MKRNLLGLLLVVGFVSLATQGTAQQLERSNSATITPFTAAYAGDRVNCGNDELQYTFSKNLGGNQISVFVTQANSADYIGGASQWFDAPSPITLHSVVLFVLGGELVPMELIVNIHTPEADSSPGAILATGTVMATNTSGWRSATFSSPLVITGPYVVSVMNPSTTAQAMLYTNYTSHSFPTVFSGRGERLSRAYYSGQWHHPETLYKATPHYSWNDYRSFDADFLFIPVVSYDIESDFTVSPATLCTDQEVTLTNTSTAIARSRFFNPKVFENHFNGTPDNTFTWTLPDGSTVNTVDATLTPATAGTANVSLNVNYATWKNGTACTDTKSETLTILYSDDASFAYSAASYCADATNPVANITGGSTGTFASTTGLAFADASTGEINLAGSTPGTYAVTFTTNGTCPSIASQQITITSPISATFTYAADEYCVNGSNPLPVFGAGASAGTFSADAALSLNASTGEITLATSTPGVYTVTNTIAASGGCGEEVQTFDVEIVAADDASFDYSAASYCIDATNPVANITGGSTGTFSSTTGLVFVDDATGEIDLAGSTPGTYTIEFTTNGTCPNVATFDVEIISLDDASFDYSSASYCTNESTNPVANITGGSTGTFSATTGLVFEDASTGEIDLAGSTVGGPYTVTFTTNGTCPSTEIFDVAILEADDASFAYSAASYCVDATNPVANITGGSTGTFSATTGLVFEDASTGEIDLAGSTAGGPYTVTFTTNGACPNTETFDVSITALDDASFAYSAASYCVDATNPVANITGGSTGTFTATTGLVFEDASTGEIDLAGSTVGGPYTVTFTTNGTCPNTETFDVSINALPTVTLPNGDTTLCATSGLYTLTGGSPAGGAYTVDGTSATTFQPSSGNVGTHTVVYTYTDANGCAASATGTIEVEVCVDVKEQDALSSLKLFPNPTQDIVTIEADNLTQVEVLNTLGGVVLSVAANGASKVTLDIANQPNGIYFVRVFSVNGSVTKKVNLAK